MGRQFLTAPVPIQVLDLMAPTLQATFDSVYPHLFVSAFSKNFLSIYKEQKPLEE